MNPVYCQKCLGKVGAGWIGIDMCECGMTIEQAAATKTRQDAEFAAIMAASRRKYRATILHTAMWLTILLCGGVLIGYLLSF